MQAEILDRVPTLPTKRLGIRECLGLVLADDVVAAHDVPPFANSAMDGYAVQAADVATAPVSLTVVDELAAGQVPSTEVTPGSAIKIMTGAPIPEGADAVVKVEDTETSGTSVTVRTAVEPGTAVRPAGGDVPAGTRVLTSGERIGPGHLGVLATLGVAWPEVSTRPVVAILSTGDEVVPPETRTLSPGTIRDSNRLLLRGLLDAFGAVVVDHGIVGDDPATLRRVLGHAAANADVVISSGGVSMGDHDVVKAVFGDGDAVAFHRVAMQPAKPLGFGDVDGRPYFGLPGNPVSVVVAFEQFVRPALLAMMGAGKLFRPRVAGRLAEPVRTDPAKVVFLRMATRRDGPRRLASLSGGQSSNVLSALAAADAFGVVPVGVGSLDAGAEIELEMFRWPEERTRSEVFGE